MDETISNYFDSLKEDWEYESDFYNESHFDLEEEDEDDEEDGDNDHRRSAGLHFSSFFHFLALK